MNIFEKCFTLYYLFKIKYRYNKRLLIKQDNFVHKIRYASFGYRISNPKIEIFTELAYEEFETPITLKEANEKIEKDIFDVCEKSRLPQSHICVFLCVDKNETNENDFMVSDYNFNLTDKRNKPGQMWINVPPHVYKERS